MNLLINECSICVTKMSGRILHHSANLIKSGPPCLASAGEGGPSPGVTWYFEGMGREKWGGSA